MRRIDAIWMGAAIAAAGCGRSIDAERLAFLEANAVPTEARRYKYYEFGGDEFDEDGEGYYEDLAPLPLLDLTEGELEAEPPTGFPESDLPIVHNEAVDKWIDWFTGTPKGLEFFQKSRSRMGRYESMVRHALRSRGLPEDLVYLAMIESGFNPHAYSRAHASGMWQFIKATGKRHGLEINRCVDERCDPIASTRAAMDYLSVLHEEFGDWWLAAAAYNAGEGRIRAAIERHGTRDYWELVSHGTLAAETRNYVPKLIAALVVAKQPEKYRLPPVPAEPEYRFDTVEVAPFTALSRIAQAAGTSPDALRHLNPHLRSSRTPADQEGFSVRVPVGSAEAFSTRLAALPPEEKPTAFSRHTIRSGETLGTIAQRYGTTVAQLKNLNGLKSNTIRAGAALKIPARDGETDRAGTHSKRPIHLPTDVALREEIHIQIRSGDTLWDVARAAGVSVEELRAWNGLVGSALKVGQKLALYPKANRAVAGLKTTQPDPLPDPLAPIDMAPRLAYTIKKGDTLWDIAQAHGTSIEQLVKDNHLSRTARLRVGQSLTLRSGAPVETGNGTEAISVTVSSPGAARTHTVQRGDTLWSIARLYGVSIDALRGDNGLKPGQKLQIGDVLNVRTP